MYIYAILRLTSLPIDSGVRETTRPNGLAATAENAKGLYRAQPPEPPFSIGEPQEWLGRMNETII